MSIGEAHRPLRAIVCDEIRRRILEHEYPPGTRLVEEHIAEDLGVSRNPVREALRILEAEGFVEIIPRRGAVVASLGLEESEELYEVLLHLESLAAELAARKSSTDDAVVLLEIVERSETAAAAGDYATIAELNSQFHTKVLELADNVHLEKVLTQLRHRHRGYSHIGPPAVARLAWVFAHDGGARGRTASSEHRALAEAILSGDAVRAASVSRHHISSSRAAYTEFAESGGLDEAAGNPMAPVDA